MILSPIYKERFAKLKQRFGCSDLELETLLRESHKSNTNNRLASIESLIDNQLNELDAPRGRRIYAIDWEADRPDYRWGRKPLKEETRRLSNREIKQIFDMDRHYNPSIFNVWNTRLATFRKSANIRSKIRSQRRLARLKDLGDFLKREGRRELAREGRRIVRTHARRRVRGLLGF